MDDVICYVTALWSVFVWCSRAMVNSEGSKNWGIYWNKWQSHYSVTITQWVNDPCIVPPHPEQWSHVTCVFWASLHLSFPIVFKVQPITIICQITWHHSTVTCPIVCKAHPITTKSQITWVHSTSVNRSFSFANINQVVERNSYAFEPFFRARPFKHHLQKNGIDIFRFYKCTSCQYIAYKNGIVIFSFCKCTSPFSRCDA